MHTEVQRQEITYYVSDDGLKKSKYKYDIEEYEDAIKKDPMFAFKCIMEFNYDSREHYIYLIKTQDEFKILLFTLGSLYNRDKFKPEIYEDKFDTSYMFYDIIYDENRGSVSIMLLHETVEDIKADLEEFQDDNIQKMLNDIETWERVHTHLMQF